MTLFALVTRFLGARFVTLCTELALVQHPLVLHSLGKEKGEMVEEEEEDGSAVEVEGAAS